MSQLRSQQKARRRQQISDAALQLFVDQGFQETTIEQIAREAQVSSPTVFNYFGSKQEILLELLVQADGRAVQESRERLADYADPLDALCDLESRLVGYALDAMPPELWRQLLPAVLRGGDEGVAAKYQALNRRLQREIALILRELQKLGKLRADLDIELAAFLLNDYSHLQLLRLVNQSPLDLATHREQVRRTSRLILEGMLPRA